MRISARRGVCGSAAALGLLVLSALSAPAEQPGPLESAPQNETDAVVRTPEEVIEGWPERPRVAARALIAEYGEPDIVDEDELRWVGKRPWDETAVRREAPEGETVKQSIHYPAARGKLDALSRLGARLEFDESSGELASLSDSENFNFLALNAADAVVSGKRSVEEAAALYRRTRELSASGKSSPDTRGFLFPRGPAVIGAPK